MTTDTVTADDLAAALRSVLDQIASGLDEFAEDDMEQAEAILDRFDAQRREDDLKAIREEIKKWEFRRYVSMRNAVMGRAFGSRQDVTDDATKARAANHRILHLKRDLRAMGGDV